MISPTDIIFLLETYTNESSLTPIDFVQSIFAKLPTCKQNRIAVLQCTMIESKWKPISALWYSQYGIDLRQMFNAKIAS